MAVIRADSHPEAHGQPDNDLAVDLARLRIGDTPDTVPVLNIHEMSDMVLAYASVTGTLDLVTLKLISVLPLFIE